MTPGLPSRAAIWVQTNTMIDQAVKIAASVFNKLMSLLAAVILAMGAQSFSLAPAQAASIANPIAHFAGLDKITGRLIKFDVYLDETVQFGALQITPRACYTRPPTQTQRTSTFVEVDQVSLQGNRSRIFSGWMFADSPALNAIDHAVYDIWLVDCRQSSEVPSPDQRETPETTQNG